MRYFVNPAGASVKELMTRGVLDCIVTPVQYMPIPEGAQFCADNGCYGKGYPGDIKWLSWIDSLPRERCRFVVAPDVVADAAATWERSRPLLPMIRERGFPAAYVAQDGAEDIGVPWEEFDVLFLGGSTDWKLGPHARTLVEAARARGIWVHMGRVNSARRLRYARSIGCDSVDGTFLIYGPSANLPILIGWLTELDHPTLDGMEYQV